MCVGASELQGVGVHVRYTCLAVLGLLELVFWFTPTHSGKWETPGLQTGSCAHVFAEPARYPFPSNANQRHLLKVWA